MSDFISIESKLAELLPGITLVDPCEEKSVLDGEEVISVGVSALSEDGSEVSGSASGLVSSFRSVLFRSAFELVERLSIKAAKKRRETGAYTYKDAFGNDLGAAAIGAIWPEVEQQKMSLSSGVALAKDWAQAARSAYEELLERDSILNAWFFGLRPERMSSLLSVKIKRLEFYRVGTHAVMAVRRDGDRFDFGFSFAYEQNLKRSQEKALGELLQRLVFCPSGEEFPKPNEQGPGLHLWETLRSDWSEVFAKWLAGDLSADFILIDTRRTNQSARGEDPVFICLTEYSPIKDVYIVKAISDQCIPLTFGAGHPMLTARSGVGLRRGIHPCF